MSKACLQRRGLQGDARVEDDVADAATAGRVLTCQTSLECVSGVGGCSARCAHDESRTIICTCYTGPHELHSPMTPAGWTPSTRPRWSPTARSRRRSCSTRRSSGSRRIDPQLNAVIIRWFDHARDVAAGDLPDGPFRGVPFLLKDLWAHYAGQPLTQRQPAR